MLDFLKLLLVIFVCYLYDRLLFYLTEKYYCKKNKGNCKFCKCWSCKKYNKIREIEELKGSD